MSNSVSKALQPLQARWRGLPPRQRGLAALGIAVLGLFLVWTLAVRPAWRTLDTAASERDRLEVQLQTMQRLAAEATELRATPPVTAEQATAALKTATERLGDRARLALQGSDRAVLTVSGVGTAALRDWLAEARSGARARAIDARLARGAQGYSGTLTVAIGGGA